MEQAESNAVATTESGPVQAPCGLLSWYIVLDFEATCESGKGWLNEIIEFPAVMLDAQTLEPVAEFREFVMPTENPQLTPFCINLTRITQEQIEKANTLETVLCLFSEWLSAYGCGADNTVTVTCGDWDLGKQLPAECQRKGIIQSQLPELLKR